MLDASREAMGFVSGIERERLEADRQLVYAVVYALLVVGEAAARVSPAVRGDISVIPWPEIIGMRNHLVHGYADVDLDIVWKAVAEDLPVLVAELERVLA